MSTADPLRVAVWHTELSRDGPGLLLRDITRGEDAQVMAVVQILARTAPDIVVLRGIDWDLDGRAVTALARALEAAGHPMPHHFAGKPNRGQPTGVDVDGDGVLHRPEDAQSYGKFTGENGLAVLSRWPIATESVRDYSQLLWRDLPGALLPWPGQAEDVADVLRLASTAQWVVPVDTGSQGRVWIGAFAAETPVFDGPEDRNGRRNHDELTFWRLLLEGALEHDAPPDLILAGHANLDPARGEGRREAITALLAHPALQDPVPEGAAGPLTVDWRRDDLEPMRLTYVLPGRAWRVRASGVVWPEAGTEAAAQVAAASRHHLVWVDLDRAP